MKTMKKLPFFVLALLFLMGCQAKPATDDTDSDVSIVEWEHSDIYTDADIQAAMDTVMTCSTYREHRPDAAVPT